jgi:hypothetical protein
MQCDWLHDQMHLLCSSGPSRPLWFGCYTLQQVILIAEFWGSFFTTLFPTLQGQMTPLPMHKFLQLFTAIKYMYLCILWLTLVRHKLFGSVAIRFNERHIPVDHIGYYKGYPPFGKGIVNALSRLRCEYYAVRLTPWPDASTSPIGSL